MAAKHYELSILIMIITLFPLLAIHGCTSTTTTPFPQQPVEVISVTEIDNATPNPGGGTVKIVLKNTSKESIVSLNVTLEESGPRRFNYDFGVSQSNPLKPNKSISSERRLIGGGWGAGTPYFLEIYIKTESGKESSFQWRPENTP